MIGVDYDLAFLLSLDGYEYRFAAGHRVRFEAREVKATAGRPHGIKYSLTLHDPDGRRIYGLDNAHPADRGLQFDHRHVYGKRKIVGYAYRGPVALLDDFYHEVERILAERGVRWR
jgi:Family of unknown function (DUF6516)